MCINTSTVYAKVAESDITTYKLVRHTYRIKGVRTFKPIVYDKFNYTLGSHYTESRFKDKQPWMVSDNGFYSWASFEYAKRELDSWRRSYTRTGYVLIKCTIPKGTRYYVSESGSTFCSEEIRIDAYLKDGKWIDKDNL